jgi:hypothetical protein
LGHRNLQHTQRHNKLHTLPLIPCCYSWLTGLSMRNAVYVLEIIYFDKL